MGLSKPRFLPVFLGFLLMLAMVSLTANSPAFATGAESVIFNFNSSGPDPPAGTRIPP